MKLLTDIARCAGHARCRAVAPELIELDADGYNVVPVREVPAGAEPLARRVARACPEGIIGIEE